MRTSGLTLAGTVILALLVGLPVGVGAQTEMEEPMGLTLVTETVEPGVERVLRDGVGHDLTQRYPNHRRDMDRIAVGPDGTVWIASTAHGSDNALLRGFQVWALGKPGIFGFEDNVPEYIASLSFDAAGTLWATGSSVASFDGTAWVPVEDVAAFDGEEVANQAVSSPSCLEAPDGTLWVLRRDGGVEAVRGDESSSYLERELINEIALAPDGTLWVAGDVSGREGGVYAIRPDAEASAKVDGASCEWHTGPVYSTATFELIGVQDGEMTEVDEILQERAGSVTISIAGGDPRTNGILAIDPYNADEEMSADQAGIFWGTARMETADGTWEGPLRGITHADGFTSVGWLAGEGGYAGLTWFHRATFGSGTDGGATSFAESLIYGGDPPPLSPVGSAAGIARRSGVDPASLERSITEVLLPGLSLVTEEVEPGILRIVNDGVRDTLGGNTDVVSGPDGSVWLFRDTQFFRLGDPVTHEWSNELFDIGQDSSEDIEVAPDGTIWWADADGDGLKSFDGEEWTLRRTTPKGEGGAVDQVEVLADGAVLASWWFGDSVTVGRELARLDDDGWRVLSRVPGSHGARLDVGTGADLWLLPESFSDDRMLYRGPYPPGAGGKIDPVEAPIGTIVTSDVGSDGTVWLHLRRPRRPCDADDCWWLLGDEIVARFDGTDWTEFGLPDGLFDLGGIAAAPDGSLWSATCDWANESGQVEGCEWLRFDGTSWSRFLGTRALGDIDEIAFAPDGNVWTIAGPNDLYVIRPEAVAAAG